MIAVPQKHLTAFFFHELAGKRSIDDVVIQVRVIVKSSRLLVEIQAQFIGGLHHQRFANLPVKVNPIVADGLCILDAPPRHPGRRVETGQRIIAPVNGGANPDPLPIQIEVVTHNLKNPESDGGEGFVTGTCGLHHHPAIVEIRVLQAP